MLVEDFCRPLTSGPALSVSAALGAGRPSLRPEFP